MKMMKSKCYILALPILCSSCATYTMSPEALYNQVSSAEKKKVTTQHENMPIGSLTYTANGVQQIECTGKRGKMVKFANSPKVEMRITDFKNKKHLFYFDTIILQDSVFTGMNSRILGTRKSIRYVDIKKVEVQKGAKAYSYKDR